ncbi:unnamed protein product [Pelagomonas calceolata]|uniref:DUF5672 domain-containing protein n=2 Tax=Pelagomonas calceolata TaxID=35677 RepID=A0A8J2S9D7_9STRA|nr:unnamed protein product [Pelagomonas calceolata]
MSLTSRVVRALCLALATPSLAIGPRLVCDTNEFVEKLWPTYAAAHAAAVAALRNDAAPGAWRGHRYLVCSVSNRGLGNKLLFELMPCARVAFATGRALVVRTERHIAEALGGVDFAAAPGEAPAIAWLAPGLADACPGSPGSCQSHELVCDRRRPAHLPALCGRRLGHPGVADAAGDAPVVALNCNTHPACGRAVRERGRAAGRCDGVLAAAFFPLAAGVRDAAATFVRRTAGGGGAYAAFHVRVGEREALEVFETAVWGLLERAHKEPTAADWQCYAARYPDVGAAFGRNVGALARHHYRHGFAEGRNPYCEAALHGDALVEAAFGALNASRARDPGFVGVVLRKFHDAVAIARRAGGPVVVLSDSAAVAPLLRRAYPAVRLVAPPGEPGHVEPAALLRKALFDLLVIGAAADLRASHHSTFHASARKLFAPSPIHKLRPRPPPPPALARVVLIDVRPDVDERHASKLHAVAANLCEKLPGTPVVFFHHSAAAAAAAALARAHACVAATTAVDAQIPGLEGFSVGKNVVQYNALLKTEAFWRSTGADRDTVLLAQADSGVCGAGAAVEAFARYDYCGAVTRFGVAWAPTQNGGFSIRNVGCMRRVIRAFAAGAFRDGNTRRGGLARVAEDAFFTQGAALFCDKRAWGFHKNWNYGRHAARREAWEKAGGGPAPPPYDPDIATCAANRALADLHVAPAAHGGGPATETRSATDTAATAAVPPVRVHAWIHPGRDGFGSQFFNKMAVFGACRLVPDDGCCYIHTTIKKMAHGVDVGAAEAVTGLRSDARCASRHPQTLPRAITPEFSRARRADRELATRLDVLAHPAVRRELRKLYDAAIYVGSRKVASNESYVCLAESIRRRDATAKICVFSEGSPADFGALAGAPGVELVLGGDALETFHHLVTAPHLFISSSTFGLAAAVLATQAKIYTAPVGDFASQLAGCWGECDCPGVRRKLTGPHGWPCCGPPPDARAFLARHDPWARFGLEAPHA